MINCLEFREIPTKCEENKKVCQCSPSSKCEHKILPAYNIAMNISILNNEKCESQILASFIYILVLFYSFCEFISYFEELDLL